MPRTLSVLLIMMEEEQTSMFEILGNLSSCCEIPSLKILVITKVDNSSCGGV